MKFSATGGGTARRGGTMSVSLVSLEPAQCQAHREDRRESLSTAFTEGWEPKTCFPRELQTMPFSSPAFVCSQVTGCVSCWGVPESVWVARAQQHARSYNMSRGLVWNKHRTGHANSGCCRVKLTPVRAGEATCAIGSAHTQQPTSQYQGHDFWGGRGV